MSDSRGISLVVLAKDSTAAKTRLRLPPEHARALALRLAAATVRAGVAAETVGAVFVVTSDPDIARDAVRAGAAVVDEQRPVGMNRAAAMGRRQAFASRPNEPVGVIVADLPGVHPRDLDAVVHGFHVAGCPVFVPDHEGTGTTFVVHAAGRSPGFGFGLGSAAMHERLGYRRAEHTPRAMRWDLDTEEDLSALSALPAANGTDQNTRLRPFVHPSSESRVSIFSA